MTILFLFCFTDSLQSVCVVFSDAIILLDVIRLVEVCAVYNIHNSYPLNYECVCVCCEESMWCYRRISVLMRGCGQGGRGQPLPQAKSRGHTHAHTHIGMDTLRGPQLWNGG